MSSIRSAILELFQNNKSGLTTNQARAALPHINQLTVGAQINHLAADGLLTRNGKREVPGVNGKRSRSEIVFKYQKEPPKINLELSESQQEEVRRQADEISPKSCRFAFMQRAEVCEQFAAVPVECKLGTYKSQMIGKADRVIALWREARAKLEAMT